MKIDRKWLKTHDACADGKEFFLSEGITDAVAGIENLLAKGHANWANWLVARCLSRKGAIAYAIHAAESVLMIFEGEYPKDDRPRKAIEAAKAVLLDDSPENREKAASAAHSAAESAAYSAAYSAADKAADYWAAYNADVLAALVRFGLEILKGELKNG